MPMCETKAKGFRYLSKDFDIKIGWCDKCEKEHVMSLGHVIHLTNGETKIIYSKCNICGWESKDDF